MNRLLLLPLLLLACSDRDLCTEAPLCEDGRAINCEPSCPVGPCSTGPSSLACGESATCTIVPGDLASPRFFRSRALCVEEGSASCDPATAGPPVCPGDGLIQGCSAYKRVIRAPCAQAVLYFTNVACCSGAGPVDGGTPDGGTSSDGGP
ncbi:hypothetical protein [Stigmatella aurantiaca]|uniref:Conserved uncharacterized protein n=1 Tax=Stigmatella aurantiaca (strain DW4/3-1) TaxID=378806 RepID=Q08QS7_STIAD|nr:hypothetical protein [Stigmatella aurantiaca]ADO74069.1 conserved uncharacterized protein [Stigmatella aurantiaca DW4/3-1]EAU62838.1 OX40 [Stigmatella aurantiaca DW4/3-1]